MEVFHKTKIICIKEYEMKRIVLLAMCLVVVASGAFSLDKAIGGGILYNTTWTDGSIDFGGSSMDWTMNRNGFGAFAFFGVSPFVEFNLGFLYKDPYSLTVKGPGGYSATLSGSDIDLEGTGALQLGIYGKYPIPISSMFVFFPTGGIDFEISTSSEEWSGWKWWHDLWIRAGVGMDVFFTEKMFLRTHLIYGAAIPIGGDEDMGLKFGHGLLIKLGVGWMF